MSPSGTSAEVRTTAPLRLLGDEHLARFAGRGYRPAFALIYRRHHQALYRYCRSIVTDPHDAEDALQATMAKALVGIGGLRGKLRPWLFRIAHNESISIVRGRRKVVPLASDSLPDLRSDPDLRAQLAELMADLEQLPLRQRASLLMRELCGLQYSEIGAAFGCSQGAARQSVFEARAGLAEAAGGRETSCGSIRRSISDGDRRALRGRRVRAHLRSCPSCRDFSSALAARPSQLRVLAPALPAATGTTMLRGLLGGGAAGGGAAKLGGVSLGFKAALAGLSTVVAGGVVLSTGGVVGERTGPAAQEQGGSGAPQVRYIADSSSSASKDRRRLAKEQLSDLTGLGAGELRGFSLAELEELLAMALANADAARELALSWQQQAQSAAVSAQQAAELARQAAEAVQSGSNGTAAAAGSSGTNASGGGGYGGPGGGYGGPGAGYGGPGAGGGWYSGGEPSTGPPGWSP